MDSLWFGLVALKRAVCGDSPENFGKRNKFSK